MEMKLVKSKDKKIIERQIKLVLGLSLLIILLATILLININSLSIFESEIHSSITGVNYVLAFIAVLTCWLHYYIYRSDEFFIITLVYISFAIEFLCETILIGKIQGLSEVLGLLIFTSTSRMFLISLIIKGENKVTEIINRKKCLSVITMIVITILLIFLETYIKHVKIIFGNIDVSIIFNLAIIGYYIVSIIRLGIKITKENDFIWSIIIASINMFLIKKVYLIVSIYNTNIDLYEFSKLFTLTAFFILIIGLFIEIISKIKENEILKEELEVFYNLTEKNPINNVVVYNDKNEVIYINELIRKNKFISYYNKLSYNKEINNKLDKKTNNHIAKKIQEYGYFNDVVFLEDNTVNKLDVRIINLKNNKTRIVVSFRDITEEYNNNRQMKINENKFKIITENIKDIICMLDVQGNITYINSMAEKVSGYSSEELLGKNYKIGIEDKEYYDFIKEEYKDGLFMEHNFICKDKSLIAMESVVSKIYTDNNEVVGHVLVLRDISYRKEFEHLKCKYNEMKAYENIRSEFFANLSHEVRTPINIIYSCFQLLNNQRENGDEALAICYNKYEKTIKQNCFRMLRLVNNLIDITKIDSGFMKMKFGNYDIINLVEDITLSVVPYVEAKKINIMFDTEVEELEIKCDPHEIERVILNLISNAIKFNEVGGYIFVNILVNDKWVEISVKDTGIGISKDLSSYVFERFAQNDKSFNREKEGSGIGLALVKSLVELHDGQVYLNDTQEKGSEFIVKLPNIKHDEVYEDDKNISGNNTKPTEEKISIELSDIYDL